MALGEHRTSARNADQPTDSYTAAGSGRASKPEIRESRGQPGEGESMSRITIKDLEVFYQVGVTDEERAKPQQLLITVEMNLDFSSATMSDRIEKTINYAEVATDIIRFGERRNWRLIEKVAANVADLVLAKYKPEAVMVEVKKFSVPQAKYVAVSLVRDRVGG